MAGSNNILIKLRHRLKGIRRDADWHFGFNRSHIINAKGARILVYHGVCQHEHLRFNTLFLKLKTFEMHLRFYKKYFNIVSLDDFYHQRFSKERFNICLTFDDGFANNHIYVLPLLEQYQAPATFFITGIRDAGYDILWNDFLTVGGKSGPKKIAFRNEEFIKNRFGKYISAINKKPLAIILRNSGFAAKAEMMHSFNSLFSFKKTIPADYWLQMTPGQIKELSASKWVTIGSHGYYHNDLEKIALNEASEEMKKSKLYLEQLTGKGIKALAFPYGAYSRKIVEEAKKTGYTQLLATDFHFEEDKTDTTMKERLTINPFISVINQMHANITGNYD